MKPYYNISSLGDSALLIHFDNRIDEDLNKKVLFVFKKLKESSLPLIDVVPAYGSIAVYYHVPSLRTVEKTAFKTMQKLIIPFLETGEEFSINARQLKVPVCYAKQFALDLEELSIRKNRTVRELIQLHTARTYRVYMIGFLPGFGYMGKVDEKLAAPRRPQPRTIVPAGSVGIAGEQTGIYPLTSPGGWNIIGRTPLKIFDAGQEEAAFFQPGDEVSFYSITEDEFENYQGGNS